MVFLADFNIAFFNTENSLAKLLKSEKILAAIPNQKKYRTISMYVRYYCGIISNVNSHVYFRIHYISDEFTETRFG